MNSSVDNVIEPEEQGSGNLAIIGEETSSQSKISLQVLQNIYHEITGKSEDVSKSYEDPFQISQEDLIQLNHRIMQSCEQYNIKAANCSVKIYYLNDTTETFSSFERFQAFNAGNSSAIESILLTYNFMILLPKIDKPQCYSLSVRIASPIAVESQFHSAMPFNLPKVLKIMGKRTAVVNVKYIDYAVARNLITTIDHWFQSVPKAEISKPWAFITRRSHFLPPVARYIVGIAVATLIFLSIENFINESATLTQYAKFSLCSLVGLFAAYRLAHHLGSSAEDSLDKWSPLAYLSLTAGDKKLIAQAERNNKGSIFKATLKFSSAILISLLAKVIVAMIPIS